MNPGGISSMVTGKNKSLNCEKNKVKYGEEAGSVPLRWTCSRFFCTSSSSSRSLNTHFSSCRHKKHKHRHHQMLQLSEDLKHTSTQFIIFSDIFTHKPILSPLHRLTIVFPAPLGPTISTELLSPWMAVRFSSSRRCLKNASFWLQRPQWSSRCRL